jgi:hypothetical protein
MYSPERFEFAVGPLARADVTIDDSVQGRQELLRAIAQGLCFPDYFGENWDALIDCLADLSWHQASEAIIDHAGLPRLSATDLKLYLESLVDAADRRAPDRRPRLRLVFRVKDREAVTAAFTDAHPRNHS